LLPLFFVDRVSLALVSLCSGASNRADVTATHFFIVAFWRRAIV